MPEVRVRRRCVSFGLSVLRAPVCPGLYGYSGPPPGPGSYRRGHVPLLGAGFPCTAPVRYRNRAVSHVPSGSWNITRIREP